MIASALMALAGLPFSASAQSVSDATADSLLRSVAVSPAAAASAPRHTWLQPRRVTDLSLRVIELPDEHPQLGARSRKHHALSWRNDTLSQALDNAGLSNAQCHNRVRLPSRLRPSTNGGGTSVQVQLQVAVGCSF